MQKFSTIFFLLLALYITNIASILPAYCIDADKDQSSPKTDDVSISDESSNNLVVKKNKKVILLVRINVPHNLRPIDTCRAYPYPVAPPHRKGKIDPIDIKDGSLRTQLRTVGYTAVTATDRPYPSGGWRMQTALKNAVAKSGLGLPHSIFTMYVWLDEMVPYIRPEVIKLNEIEKERNNHYLAAQEMFDEHRSDLEVEAFNKGLFPKDVLLHPWHGTHSLGRVELEQTNWWIVALHKTPGLKYYWLYPVRLSDEPQQLIELNEENAIHIEGGW